MSWEIIGTRGWLKKHWLLRNSNIPRRFLGLEPSDITEKTGSFPDEISTWIDDVLDSQVINQIGKLGVNGVGLLFDGSPGIGKTTHAVVAAMEVVRRMDDEDSTNILGMNKTDFGLNCRPIYYLTYPEFLSRKKSTFDADPSDRREMT